MSRGRPRQLLLIVCTLVLRQLAIGLECSKRNLSRRRATMDIMQRKAKVIVLMLCFEHGECVPWGRVAARISRVEDIGIESAGFRTVGVVGCP